jgi:hypothetical protein
MANGFLHEESKKEQQGAIRNTGRSSIALFRSLLLLLEMLGDCIWDKFWRGVRSEDREITTSCQIRTEVAAR